MLWRCFSKGNLKHTLPRKLYFETKEGKKTKEVIERNYKKRK